MAGLALPVQQPKVAPKVAIVTGGGYGIGRAVCRLAGDRGWAAVAVDRNGARAEETAAMIRDGGATAVSVAGDVTDGGCAARAVEAACALGPLKGLATCAAMRHQGPITAITAEQWHETVDVVLNGVFLFCKAVIPEMIRNGGGSIVNVSSPDSFGRKAMVAYAAAKGGVNALTQCLAADHLEHGIRANVVLPGITLSGMTEHYPEERMRELADRSVARRLAQPDDIARLVYFLLSDEGETFTGGFFGAHPLAAR
jgi:2-hydroxycyclohexanecarboxyl-CoA dehydrogenase